MPCRQLLLAVALAAGVQSAHAQAPQKYPAKPVRMIVPWTAGGTSDSSARIVAQKLAENWSQQVIVDNRGGAGGTIGTAAAAKSAPDGYTLLMGSSTEMVVSPHLYSSITYDTRRDFAPVSYVASQPLILVAHPSVPATSVQELIAIAKARPAQLNSASAGNGSTLHLALVVFENATGTKFVHVPFKGSSEAATATLSGDTQINFGALPSVIELVRSGKLRGLAVTSAKRSPAVPDLPTVAESGVPNYEIAIWNALFVPRGVPPEVIARLNADMVKALDATEVRDAFARLGSEVATSTPDQLGALVGSEWTRMGGIVAASGAKID